MHPQARAELIPDWLNIETFADKLGILGTFSNVQSGVEYTEVVGRGGRIAKANLKSVHDSFAIASEILKLLSNVGTRRVPRSRLGDSVLFDEELIVLVCRSKEDNSFHYGICVEKNDDETWHKVCTASFAAESSIVLKKVIVDIMIDARHLKRSINCTICIYGHSFFPIR
ncbi:uncharacterized protein FIBRA_00533 [Fibroporia radiculosa]|uniref:Uncharacterized protein n=1 Tax=Fibroporia radiculosa TaxID=599839 RepID=J4H065_9APHY|nr:uncharacterized protein FIBRA_00533 [Fibroporia radiculosa]CCL98534.1 predicted protein [Fibroporia radiculosa]